MRHSHLHGQRSRPHSPSVPPLYPHSGSLLLLCRASPSPLQEHQNFTMPEGKLPTWLFLSDSVKLRELMRDKYGHLVSTPFHKSK